MTYRSGLVMKEVMKNTMQEGLTDKHENDQTKWKRLDNPTQILENIMTKKIYTCNHCKQLGHSWITSLQCRLNSKYVSGNHPAQLTLATVGKVTKKQKVNQLSNHIFAEKNYV